jgi:uncharacterized protein (TIGR02284 family)
MAENETVDVLQELIETCRDGENGFREAAEKLMDPEIKNFFIQQSGERARFARELEEQVRAFGGKVEPREQKGSVAGALHRGWINLKAELGGGEGAILGAAETGEDSAKETYEKAINRAELPASVQDVVRRQYESIRSAHDRVKMFRDRKKAA